MSQTKLGEQLRVALDRYAPELNIISTSRTLPPRLLVTALPDAAEDSATQVRTILAPHGLDIVMVDETNAYVTVIVSSTSNVESTVLEISRSSVIEEILVTSRYQMRHRAQTGHSLEHQDLMSLPSLGRDTLRGLDTLPGVAGSGISAMHQFRGGDANETLYRLDGVELLEPFHLQDVQSLFSTININVIEAADVYVAGFPVSMGNRMSGVVDLQPLDPVSEFSGSVDLNLITASLDGRGRRGGWSWIASARQSTLQHSLKLFESDFGEPRFNDQLLRIVHDSGDRKMVAGLLSSTDRVKVRDETEEGIGRSKYRAGWLRWEQVHSSRWQSEWQISLISIDNERSGEVDIADYSRGALRERRNFQTIELKNSWQWRLTDDMDVEAGWSVASQEGNFRAVFNTEYGPLVAPIQPFQNVSRDTTIDRSGESLVAYLSFAAQLNDAVTIETGLRYDGQDIDPVHVNEVSARASVDYHLTEALDLTLNLGRYTQQQQLYEIQIDDGKAELDAPQHSDQINVTLQWQLNEGTRLRGDLYWRSVNNPWSHFENLYNRWVLLPELQGDRYEIVPSRARSRGLELAYMQRLDAHLSWQASYAWNNAEEHHSGRFRNKPWQETHSFKAGLRWHSDLWRVGLNATYRSGWPATPLIGNSSQLNAELYDERLRNYFSLNLHVSRTFRLPRTSLQLYLDVINLTNRKNVGGYDYDRGRHAQRLLPITPTLGVSWRW